jgi:hypothetical protein
VPFYHIAEDPEDALLSPLYYTILVVPWLGFSSIAPQKPHAIIKVHPYFLLKAHFYGRNPPKLSPTPTKNDPKNLNHQTLVAMLYRSTKTFLNSLLEFTKNC